WETVITHGNGPQVGFILRRSELARAELHEVPLDFCDADSQGAIGYMFQQALGNEFRRVGIAREVVSVVTQTVVAADDPAFQNPAKPIGSFMDEDTARERAAKNGWVVVEDSGRGWRRVVASPMPRRIVETEAIRALLAAGIVVIAVGGGGIPVVELPNGNLRGVEAVIDKDFGSALLASALGADLFVISTSVEKVALNWGRKDQTWVDRMTLDEARARLSEGHFAKGSMGPKIEAIIRFLEAGGREAIVTNPENIEQALAGRTGTRIVR
ncbi:MAG TPA: carbamate kinase, partial [Thermoanaerobaculia bacterium]